MRAKLHPLQFYFTFNLIILCSSEKQRWGPFSSLIFIFCICWRFQLISSSSFSLLGTEQWGQLTVPFSCSISSEMQCPGGQWRVESFLSPFSEAFQQFLLVVCIWFAVLGEFPFQLDALCYFTIALSRQLKKCKQFNALLSPLFFMKMVKVWKISDLCAVFQVFCLPAFIFTHVHIYKEKAL